jgi:hypothetical protein
MRNFADREFENLAKLLYSERGVGAVEVEDQDGNDELDDDNEEEEEEEEENDDSDDEVDSSDEATEGTKKKKSGSNDDEDKGPGDFVLEDLLKKGKHNEMGEIEEIHVLTNVLQKNMMSSK